MEGSRLPNKLILGPLIICIFIFILYLNFSTFAGNLGTKVEKEMKRTEKTDKILVKYKQYLKLEKSLSDNTVDAYLTDLDKLLAYLTLENINILDVRLENLEDFSAGLHDIGIHPVRRHASCRIRSSTFPHYGRLPESRSDRIAGIPQTGFKLPEVMTVEEIDLLIGSIDRSTKEGQRNRAILETLYSCGLRVSELCNLKLSELYFEEGFIKVEGKGSKQRLVPISPRAIKEIRLYFTDRNLMKIKPGFEDFVFISNFGKNISRIMVSISSRNWQPG